MDLPPATFWYLRGESAEVIHTNMWRFGLTRRERKVAWEYIHGRPRLDIADMLGCAPETVKAHLTTIKRRCGYNHDCDEASTNRVRLLRLLLDVPPVAAPDMNQPSRLLTRTEVSAGAGPVLDGCT